jgi:hypothetical protein
VRHAFRTHIGKYAQSRESTLSKDLSHVEAIQPGKRARDNKESELIERTRTRFTRVLEGIRAIIHLENEKEAGGASK